MSSSWHILGKCTGDKRYFGKNILTAFVLKLQAPSWGTRPKHESKWGFINCMFRADMLLIHSSLLICQVSIMLRNGHLFVVRVKSRGTSPRSFAALRRLANIWEECTLVCLSISLCLCGFRNLDIVSQGGKHLSTTTWQRTFVMLQEVSKTRTIILICTAHQSLKM